MKKTFAALLVAGLAFAAPAAAQKYPASLIKIVVPFPAGGTTDILARQIGQALTEKLGVGTIVENRPGASGMIGSEAVARSAPDGSTLLVAATHHVINPSLYKKLLFDTQKDFAPVALIASGANALVVHPSFPAKTVAELIAIAKKEPGKLTFASTGVGGANHLAGELFKLMAGVDILHLPYRGAAPAMTDLLGGHVPMMFDSLPTVLSAVQSGTLRALAVTSRQRDPSLPEVPTLDEAGVKGFEAIAWFGMYMPAGASPARAQLEQAMKEILAKPELKEAFVKLGLEPGTLVGEPFGRFVSSEIAKWGEVVKKANVPQQ